MAKSSRRKKQDRARTERRHAAESRRQAEGARRDERADATRNADGLFDRATDLALAPTALAALIMDELADSTGTGLIAYARLQKGAEPATLAEAARLLIAACPGAGGADGPSSEVLPPGVLAFAAVAAHASGDEAEEARHTQALLDLARAADDEARQTHPLDLLGASDDDAKLQVAGDVLGCTHPVEAAEMFRRYLLDHPASLKLIALFAQPSVRAELAEAGWTGFDEFDVYNSLGDPSDPGFAERLVEHALQAWKPDPEVRAWYGSRARIANEFLRRRGMPPA